MSNNFGVYIKKSKSNKKPIAPPPSPNGCKNCAELNRIVDRNIIVIDRQDERIKELEYALGNIPF